jgi:hypothetical protein
MTRRLLMGVALATTVLATSAAAQDPGCFFVRDVGGRSVADMNTLYFGVLDKAHMTTRAYFRVKVTDCNVIAGSNSRAGPHGLFSVASEVPAPGASAQVCSVKQLKIWTGTSCHVESLQRLTPAEVAALPRGVKPSS